MKKNIYLTNLARGFLYLMLKYTVMINIFLISSWNCSCSCTSSKSSSLPASWRNRALILLFYCVHYSLRIHNFSSIFLSFLQKKETINIYFYIFEWLILLSIFCSFLLSDTFFLQGIGLVSLRCFCFVLRFHFVYNII